MAKLASCPTEDELRELLLGKGVESVGEHLLDCPQCGANAGRLVASDPMLVELRAAHETSEIGTDGTFVEELLRRIKQPASAMTLPDPELAFLDPATAAFPTDLGMFNHYRIVEKIGEGGMGMVFRAVDSNLQRTVALKIILPKYAANQKLRDRFIEEARATVKVRSPHVAEVYETNVWRDVPYLTMELLVGTTLDKKPKPMPADAVRRIGYSIAKGLADAHRAGMIHRDLKPSNIHLGTDSRTGKPTVKLIDFGLARPVNRDIEITKSGELLGTPAYMSPEQARGKKVDHRTDLYSLGVILHQLATGHLPYDSASEGVMAILTELATPEPLTSVATRGTGMPPKLAKLIDQLLAKDPANRPASADEVMKVLRESLTEKSTSSTGTEVAESAPYVSISDATAQPFAEMATEPLVAEPGVIAKPKRKWLWPAVGALVAIALMALGLNSLRVKTPNGTIEFVDLPADAEVLVDGKAVTVSWNEGREKAVASVTPGSPTVEVKVGGVVVTGEKVTVASGETKPFVVRFEKPAAVAVRPDPAGEKFATKVVVSDELVVNGTCDNRGFRGWTVEAGKWVPIPADVPDPYFRPGKCAEAVLSQEVDVGDYAKEIDAGQLELKFSGLIRCYSKGQKDKAQLRMTFLDKDKKHLAVGYDTGLVHEPQWKEYGATRKPEAGTRFVRIVLHSHRQNSPGNEENSGYYDTISLKALVTKRPETFATLRPGQTGSSVQYFGIGFRPQTNLVTGPEAYANLLMMGVSPDAQTYIDAARRAKRTVVLLFQGKAREGIETGLYPLIEANRDTVAGVFWSLPYANGYNPTDVASFGRALKQKFPGLTYFASFVEKPNGKHETKPVPDEVDAIAVTVYFDTTPAMVRAKTDDCLPAWAAKANGRPIFLLWTNWDNTATGIVPRTQPGTFRACLESAKKHKIAGILFHPLYSGTTEGLKSIDSNPALFKELEEIGRELNATAAPVSSAKADGPNGTAIAILGQVKVVGDELSLEPDVSPGSAAVTFGDTAWTDYDLVADVKGNGFLYARVTDRDNFWICEARPEAAAYTCELRVKSGGVFTSAGETKNVLNTKADGWNRLKLSVRGPVAIYFFNDREVGRHIDARNPKGHIGLGAFRGEARFRNVSVTAPDGRELYRGFPDLAPSPSVEFKSLFNGKDLTGWTVDRGDAKQWSVVGGTIAAMSNSSPTRNYLLSDGEYSDFVLRFEFKVGDDRSHGAVALRAERDEKVPLNAGLTIFDHPLIKLTNSTQIAKDATGANHWLRNSEPYSEPLERPKIVVDQWHAVEVVVRGDTCTASFDGRPAVDIKLDPKAESIGGFIPGLKRTKGKVGFQINTGRVWYRKVEIREWTGPAATPKVGVAPVDRRAKFALGGKFDRTGEELSIAPDKIPGNAAITFGDPKWTDYDVEVDAKGNGWIYFRVTDVQNFWDFEAMPEKDRFKCRIAVKSDGKFKPVADAPNTEESKADGWNRMKVSVRGDKAIGYFNGREVLRYTDDRNPAGMVSLGAFQGEARYKNLTVTAPDGTVLFPGLPELPAPEPPVATPVPQPPPAPAKADPFKAGSVWRGVKIIEKGDYAGGTMFYEVTIKERTGNAFTGSVWDNGPNRNPETLAGTVDGNKIDWRESPLNNPTHFTAVGGTHESGQLILTTKGTFGNRGNSGRARLFHVRRVNEIVPDEFHSIFDGRGLSNWETHPAQKDGWSTNQFGRLVGKGNGVGHLYTKREFGDVHVWCRAKLNDGGNGGLFPRSTFGPVRGFFPDGYEAQLACNFPNNQPTGTLFVWGTKYVPAVADTVKPGEWFTLEAIVRGKTVQVLLNGKETVQFTDPTPRPKTGRIALQLHDAKTEIEFAAIAVKELK